MTKILFLTTNNVLLGVFPSLQSSDIKTNVVLWLWDQHVERRTGSTVPSWMLPNIRHVKESAALFSARGITCP